MTGQKKAFVRCPMLFRQIDRLDLHIQFPFRIGIGFNNQ